jgi:hypothetical protein
LIGSLGEIGKPEDFVPMEGDVCVPGGDSGDNVVVKGE